MFIFGLSLYFRSYLKVFHRIRLNTWFRPFLLSDYTIKLYFLVQRNVFLFRWRFYIFFRTKLFAMLHNYTSPLIVISVELLCKWILLVMLLGVWVDGIDKTVVCFVLSWVWTWYWCYSVVGRVSKGFRGNMCESFRILWRLWRFKLRLDVLFS